MDRGAWRATVHGVTKAWDTTAHPPGSQASSRGEAKDSALLSSRDAALLEPPERQSPSGMVAVLNSTLESREGTRALALDPGLETECG